MSMLTRLYNFVAGQRIKSAEVNEELNQLIEGHNSNETLMTENIAKADGAVARAAAATTTAESAVTKANTAITTANAADTKAGNAVTTANAADTKAGNAVTTANTASATALAAQTKATQVETDYTAMKPELEAAVASVEGKADVAYVDQKALEFQQGAILDNSIAEAKLVLALRNKISDKVTTTADAPLNPTATTLKNSAGAHIAPRTVGAAVKMASGKTLEEAMAESVPSGQVEALTDTVNNHAADTEYQTPTIAGTQIQLVKLSTTARLFFKLDNAVSGGAITVSLDSGATSKPLVDVDGVAVTTLDKGFMEVVEDAVNFTLRPRGGEPTQVFQKAFTGTELTLAENVKAGDYIYSSEAVKLVFDGMPPPVLVDRSIPVPVVNSAYDISGNGGSKITRLSNGWIVAAMYDSTSGNIHIYTSKDNGATFIYSGYKGCWVGGNVYFAITSYGTDIYILFTQNVSTKIYCVRINMLTANGGDFNSSVPIVELDTQTSFSAGCSIFVDSNGKLYAAWCSKNSTYPNSFNVRYSTSADNGVTWAAPLQITTTNATGVSNATPCIIVCNNNPYIFYRSYDTANNIIACDYYTGSAWLSVAVQPNQGSRLQAYPSATVSPDGKIHVVWHGYDATYTNNEAIKYAVSDDGGVTWSAVETYSFGTTYPQLYPVIVSDSNSNIHLYFCGKHSGSQTYYQICKRIRTAAGAWGDVSYLTNAANHQYYPQLCQNHLSFTEPLTIWQDTQAPAIKFRGVWDENSASSTVIPSVAQCLAESQLQAAGAGVIKTNGIDVKQYVGFVNKTALGWIPSDLILYAYGTHTTSVTGGFEKYQNYNSYVYEERPGEIYISGYSGSSVSWYGVGIGPNKLIDLTNYKKLKAIITLENNCTPGLDMGVNTSKNYNVSTMTRITQACTDAVIELDVAALNGNYYIVFVARGDTTACKAHIKKVWLQL